MLGFCEGSVSDEAVGMEDLVRALVCTPFIRRVAADLLAAASGNFMSSRTRLRLSRESPASGSEFSLL